MIERENEWQKKKMRNEEINKGIKWKKWYNDCDKERHTVRERKRKKERSLSERKKGNW